MSFMHAPLSDGYQAAHNSVALLDLTYRGKVKVTGPDRVTFLHAMITNDVIELPEWRGRYGAFLTSTGKIVSDFYYYRFPQHLLLDLEPFLLSKTVETLEKFIIMDDVLLQIASGQFGHFSLQGPCSVGLLQTLFNVEIPETEYQVRPATWKNEEVWILRKSDLAAIGFEILFPRQTGSSLRQAIETEGRRFGLHPLDDQAREVLRMEAGTPLYGVDMNEKNYPMEARLESAISFTKGCYIGQEVVSKATYIGGVSRLLMPLKLSGAVVPAPGAAVFTEEGEAIGRTTSAVFSPRLECVIALAYLKRRFVRPGLKLRVELTAASPGAGQVVDRFLPSATGDPSEMSGRLDSS